MNRSVIFFSLVCLQISAYAFSQQISLHTNGESLKSVLTEIRKQSGYQLLYNADLLREAKPVTVKINQGNIEEVLTLVFEGQPLQYQVENKTILVQRRTESMIRPLMAKRQLTVKGVVTDQSGETLPGVSVLERGTKNGTTTNEDGEFSLVVSTASVSIVFSSMGYVSQEILATAEPLRVVMEEDQENLEEVVVVGFGTQKKENLTGAIASVDAKKLENRPVANLGQGLQGLVPNLNISSDNGKPGTGSNFNVRGTGSIDAGKASPLILVDGVQRDPNSIDPSDVESVTVLKDAAAAAIYGGRAAYGVILIQTKNPVNQKPQINYSGEYTTSRPTKMPRYINSIDYIRMHREANRNGQDGGTTATEIFTVEDSIRAQAYFNDPVNNLPVYIDPSNPARYRYVGNTDWIKEQYPGWAPMQRHNVSLQGGQGATSVLASLGYLGQEGLFKAADQKFQRLNPTLKVNSEIADWITVHGNFAMTHISDNEAAGVAPGWTTSGWISGDLRPIMPVRHPDGNFSGQGSFTNPFAVALQNGRRKEYSNDIWLTGGVDIRPIEHVTLTANYTWNAYSGFNQNHQIPFQEYGVDGILLGTYPWTTPSSVTEITDNNNYFALNAFATYENTFADKHYFKAMVGLNRESSRYKRMQVFANNLVDPTLPAINLNNDPRPNITGADNEWALFGSVFRLNYIFDNKYLLEVNGRYDGSSRFSSDTRYVFTPSVSAGWRISEENFMAGTRGVLSDLKLRGSYGELPNQGFNQDELYETLNFYPYLPTMPIDNNLEYIFGNQTGVGVGTPGLVSTYFTWEKSATTNFGLDFGFLNNKLTGTFDIYERRTRDMLVAGVPLPAVLGTNAPQQNAGVLITKGWELSVNWNDRIGDDFSYDVLLSLSDNQARLTSYPLNPNKVFTEDQWYEGRVENEIWGFETGGYFNSQEEIDQAPGQAQIWGGSWRPGDVQYVDLNGDGVINFGTNTVGNPGDRRIIGNSTPRYAFGLNIGLNYKNFDFTTFLQGIGKRDVWLDNSAFWGFTSEWNVPFVYATDYWTPENTNAYFPRLRFENGGNAQAQTRYLQDASYLRVKQLTLGYSLPQTLVQKAKLNRVRLYVTAQNLFTFTKLFEAFDPEVLNFQDAPLMKSIAFGLQLGF
ncbi:TonB-dependent receptor [Olivibacter sp. SDN3]|uniref:TonB-dependent receptor n=1 Tax=Olivibacter sp. SDN3 TaxID=2764720 RepID=UPI0016516CC6|nr:TonB-dependent receptor [Olivibacter sp. SDN3]QNL50191.1 TonB-dependent receptor [Olivibacter sp. SDN3]